MKYPFFKRKKNIEAIIEESEAEHIVPEEPKTVDILSPEESISEVSDSFIEWFRTPTRGGIERRERNDIFECYGVYGCDTDGRLIYRYYHRYPEHERDFSLSYNRQLDFKSFNNRMLTELDSDSIKLSDYYECIAKAEEISGITSDMSDNSALSDNDIATIRIFCDSLDILQGQSYLARDTSLSCECESVVGGDRLIIRFRKSVTHDPIIEDVAGVKKETIGGYDIDNLWIMGIFNRLRDNCDAVKVYSLTSEWSLSGDSLYLFNAVGFKDISCDLIIAAGAADSFRKFGFYSLSFN